MDLAVIAFGYGNEARGLKTLAAEFGHTLNKSKKVRTGSLRIWSCSVFRFASKAAVLCPRARLHVLHLGASGSAAERGSAG